MAVVDVPNSILKRDSSTTSDMATGLTVYSNWFLPDHQVREILKALGKEWELQSAFRSDRCPSGEFFYEKFPSASISSLPPDKIAGLEYRRGRDFIEISPLTGKRLCESLTYDDAMPSGVHKAVEKVYDQWRRIYTLIGIEDPLIKVIQHAVGHLGDRSTVILDAGSPRTRFVFPGPYFAWDGLSLQDKMDHAMKNPMPGYKPVAKG